MGIWAGNVPYPLLAALVVGVGDDVVVLPLLELLPQAAMSRPPTASTARLRNLLPESDLILILPLRSVLLAAQL
ncbi:MAG: hypothetical protein ACLQK4_13345 [Acidimicrobiales bacterium]